ncbi:MAG TPA: hypothetical protein VFI31_19100, partial [Pirellulales bacterium]|nr:hypothetical protein [Pirellulales bacterium]
MGPLETDCQAADAIANPAETEESAQDFAKSSDPTPRATIAPSEVAGTQPSAAPKRVYRLPRPVARAKARPPQSVWGEPEVLLGHLDRLSAECDAGLWPARVADVIRELCRTGDLQSPRTTLALKRLRDLVEPNHPLLASSSNKHSGDLRRLRYAVLRRLDLWELVPELAERRSRP